MIGRSTGAAAVIAAARQRARRAFQRLSLSEAQAVAARRLLKDDRLQLEAAQGRLAECRRDLREALAAPGPDSAAVLELTLEERLLEEKERAASARLERSLAALLRPEQVTRLRTLAPAAVGDMLGSDLRLSRLSAGRSPAPRARTPRTAGPGWRTPSRSRGWRTPCR